MVTKTKKKSENVLDYTTTQLTALVILRVVIGWHFLYEGIVKVLNPYWSSAGFFLEVKGIFKGLATSIVANPGALSFVDFVNKWGLILIGLGLIAGCLTRIASISGNNQSKGYSQGIGYNPCVRPLFLCSLQKKMAG